MNNSSTVSIVYFLDVDTLLRPMESVSSFFVFIYSLNALINGKMKSDKQKAGKKNRKQGRRLKSSCQWAPNSVAPWGWRRVKGCDVAPEKVDHSSKPDNLLCTHFLSLSLWTFKTQRSWLCLQIRALGSFVNNSFQRSRGFCRSTLCGLCVAVWSSFWYWCSMETFTEAQPRKCSLRKFPVLFVFWGTRVVCSKEQDVSNFLYPFSLRIHILSKHQCFKNVLFWGCVASEHQRVIQFTFV